MSDHPDESVLLDLALSDLDQPERDELLAHLTHCEACRAEYGAIAGSVDQVLASAPRVAPPAGFSRSVLAAMGMAADRGTREDGVDASVTRLPDSAQRQGGARDRPNLLLVAVAAALALLLGVAGGVAVMKARDQPSTEVAAVGPALLTADGSRVGTVLDTRYDGRRMLAVTLTAGRVGARYECQLVLADGSRQSAGSWVLREPSGTTWLVERPATPLSGLELVTESGKTWATATL